MQSGKNNFYAKIAQRGEVVIQKELKYKELKGISEEQLTAHYGLYAGYVKKVNEIREKLQQTEDENANPTYGAIRELKLELGYALDGCILHELYFESLGGDGMPSERMERALSDSFGSFQNWQKELIALGKSARGWLVLAINEENKLEHYLADMHNQGGIWGAKPILALDVYEHAYFFDYKTDRGAYIDSFIKNIDWSAVERRL